MKKTAFFDLDGTLTDPKEGITKCIQYALEKMDVDVPVNDELTWCIGPPLLHSFELLLGKDRAWNAVNLYRERFSDIGWQENRLYPGVRKTLEQLSGAGWRLLITAHSLVPGLHCGRGFSAHHTSGRVLKRQGICLEAYNVKDSRGDKRQHKPARVAVHND